MADERPELIRKKANLERRALIYEYTQAFFKQRDFHGVRSKNV